MVDFEDLIFWLSHRAEGSWEQFKGAVTAVSTFDGIPITPGNLARALSEMAHAQFFVGGSRRWATYPPVVAGLNNPGLAVLAGGRTRSLLDTLQNAAIQDDVLVEMVDLSNGLKQVRLTSEADSSISRTARRAGLPYISKFATHLCADFRTVVEQLKAAPPTFRPANWEVRSFDLQRREWVDGEQRGTAYEYKPEKGLSRFAVSIPGRPLVQLDKRTAVYAAAHINGVNLLHYEVNGGKLSCPKGAPLPESIVRAASMCNAEPAAQTGGWLTYGGLSSGFASILLTCAGQSPIEPTFMSDRVDRR